MKKNIKNILSGGLIFALLFAINSISYINSYSVDKMPFGPSVIVASETDGASAELLVVVERYENSKWAEICKLTPGENGKAIFELQEDEDWGTFYRLSLSTNPEIAVYAFVSTDGEISYSKHFIESTCSLGDGASFKVKTLRDYQQSISKVQNKLN